MLHGGRGQFRSTLDLRTSDAYARPVAATPSVKVVKQFNFKGATRLWSNRYHFNGGTPSDDTHWHTFFDAIVAAEKAIYDSTQFGLTITECIGYAAGSDLPVSSKSYTQAGTGAFSSTGAMAPGECAALCRWSTTARSSKNHPVYLFNYWHAVHWQTSGSNPDKIETAQQTAMQTYANSWISGFSDGTLTLVRSGPNGATATGSTVEQYLTHRDFPN